MWVLSLIVGWIFNGEMTYEHFLETHPKPEERKYVNDWLRRKLVGAEENDRTRHLKAMLQESSVREKQRPSKPRKKTFRRLSRKSNETAIAPASEIPAENYPPLPKIEHSDMRPLPSPGKPPFTPDMFNSISASRINTSLPQPVTTKDQCGNKNRERTTLWQRLKISMCRALGIVVLQDGDHMSPEK